MEEEQEAALHTARGVHGEQGASILDGLGVHGRERREVDVDACERVEHADLCGGHVQEDEEALAEADDQTVS
jgi:hypothetical protein